MPFLCPPTVFKIFHLLYTERKIVIFFFYYLQAISFRTISKRDIFFLSVIFFFWKRKIKNTNVNMTLQKKISHFKKKYHDLNFQNIPIFSCFGIKKGILPQTKLSSNGNTYILIIYLFLSQNSWKSECSENLNRNIFF